MRSKTPYVKLLLTTLVLFLLTGSSSLFGQILFQSSFEGANPFAGWSNSQSCCSYSVTASTLHPHDGTQSFKSEVRVGDPAVSSGYRAELTLPNISDQGDMWYGMSMYFEANTGNNWGGQYGHVLQWHPNNGSGSAQLSIFADGGAFDICVNEAGCSCGVHQTTGLQNIVANKWYDIVFHVNWASSGGSVQVWIDGQLYFTKTNLNWAPNPYLKLGMNRWLMSNTWVVYYDNFKVGRNVTYNDVAPSASAPGNQSPVVNAGNNITLTLPTNSATLTGSATDADGTVASYAWTRVSGPNNTPTLTFGTPNAASTTIGGLVAGTYVFRLTATDNAGATGTDDVTVTVNAPANTPPTANAGGDITITLPTSTATLVGSGTDANGTISSYLWTRVSGPNQPGIANANAATTGISNLVAGTYVFRLTVTDNGGATATDNVTVTVNPAPNQVPTANAGSDITLTLPTNTTTLTGSGTDPDGTISTYAWTRVSGPNNTPALTIGTPNAASTTLGGLIAGTYVFRLTVTDNSGATATDNVTVTVNAAPNTPPTANAGNNITITLPTNSTTLTGSGTDANGTIAGYAWTRISGPNNTPALTIGTPNAASTTIGGLIAGTYTFRLTVTDNNGATGTDDVTVTVNPAPNQPPVAEAGNNITITLPTNTTTLTGSATDADGTIQTYVWTRVSGPNNTPALTIGTPNAASTNIGGLVAGTYIFRLTVTDNSGATDIDDVTVTVNAIPVVNTPPIANAGNNITLNLPTNNTTLNGSASTDPNGTIQTYAWSWVSGPPGYNIANAAGVTTALTGLSAGTYVFKLTVTDNGGATDEDNITVVVSAVPNQPPSANAGNNITLTLPVNSTNLNGGSSTDADGTINTYAWSWVSGNGGYSIANASASATGLSGLAQGTYVFRLTVTDNDGATATDDITVTVNAAVNQPPTANAGSDITMTLPVNSAILTGSGYDPNGTIATYAWTHVSGPAFNIVTTGAASTGINGLGQGVHVFRLTVTDNNGATASDLVTVTVLSATNVAPNVNAGADITITLPVNTTTLNGSATDPDGAIAGFAWTRVSGPNNPTMGSASSASTGVSGLVAGTYVFRLTATDNNGASASDNVTVTVNAGTPAANQAPNARAGNNITLTMPDNATSLYGNASFDVDGVISAYEWTQVSGPAQVTIGNRLTSIANLTGLLIGDYVFQLKVTDDDGATSTATVNVTVKNKDGAGYYFNVFPSPTSGTLNIQYSDNNAGKVQVSVFDINRRLLLDKIVDKSQVTLITSIDATVYQNGMYLLQLTLPDGQRVVKQFVKM